MGFVAPVEGGTALADNCSSGMTMGQFGVCVPATNGESSTVSPEWRQASGGDAVDPDSPTSICQSSPPCPEGATLILSDCECPPR
ncbi:MAG: hypothetical protein KDB72_10205 [Mycobacterium sp.]|nr:hypothetical protein [Mycobacterium sp.]